MTGPGGSGRRDPGAVALLAAILHKVPKLHGAACTGRHELFDEGEYPELHTDRIYRHRAAAALCRTCPALAACRSWADQQPTRTAQRGVIAGQILQTSIRASDNHGHKSLSARDYDRPAATGDDEHAADDQLHPTPTLM